LTDKIYDGYEYGELGYSELHKYLLPLLQPGMTALDIGFGTGHMSSPLAFAEVKIVGLDQNMHWLEIARAAFDEAGLGDRLVTVHAEALEYMRANEEKYGLVVMSDFLMFQRKTAGKEIIRLAHEALESGGLIWITTLSTGDECFFRMTRSQEPIDDETFMSYSPCGGSGPICFYFPREIEQYLESLGAKTIFQTETINDAGGMFNIILAEKPG